jgi:hypothetical protein
VKSWRDSGDTHCRQNYREEAKLWPLLTSSQCRESPLHVERRNQEGPWATSHPCPDDLGRWGQVLSYFMCHLWWDNYRTTSESPSPGLEAETDTKIIKTKTSLHLNLEVFFLNFQFFILFYFIYIHIFLLLTIFYFYSYLYSFYFYFQSSLCLSNACSAYCWLVHCLYLFISLKIFCLILCFVFSYLSVCFSLFL